MAKRQMVGVSAVCTFGAAILAVGVAKQTTPTQFTTASAQYEITSPLGRKFYSLPDEKGTIAAAQKDLAANPNDVKLMLKVALAQASVWQDREAVATCTNALHLAPENSDLYLERGHREVALRRFADARTDLEHAIRLDSRKVEAYYHLGLARYFLGEFSQAADAFQHAVDQAPDTDSRINSTNWLYASLRRAKRADDAAAALARITPDITTSGHSLFYLHLVRFFQGTIKESDAVPAEPVREGSDFEPELQFDTVAYGVGNWYLYNGNADKAREYFERVVKGRVWITWGFVGSETEIARRKS
ncbi:MAG: tetratricopeptide repeat protein [Acidobacteriaceae bacterium]|nr:tetratricopeptide repeat protein [Acidobacteriaceae bacterium]